LRIVMLLLLIMLVGCNTNGNTNESLTLKQVLDAFQEEGLQLNNAKVYPENIFQQGINGVTPSFYQLSDGVIHFYIFKSENERKKGREDFYNRPVSFVAHSSFEIKNVLILYVYGKNQGSKIDEKIKAAIKKLE
jgi:hypothetical protein